MKLHVHKTEQLQGTAIIPGSKSQSVRALLFALAAKGTSTLTNLVDAKDTEAAIAVVEAFGAKVERLSPTSVKVRSEGPPFKMNPAVFSGNSGITTRFMMPLIGFTNGEPITWDCGEQMRARPMQPLLDALRELGLTIEGNQFPLQISGQIQGGEITVDGTTSQYLSALLMTLPLAPNPSLIHVDNLQERPYVDMTLSWLTEQGIEIRETQEGSKTSFHIPGAQSYQPIEKEIPGDWSSASYGLAAGALFAGEITLKGLSLQTHQGDHAVLQILQEMGAKITAKDSEITIQGGHELTAQTIDCSQIPDMLPTLAVIATQAEGETQLINCAHARIKETDRIHSMAEGLRAMGADIEEKEDGLVICKSQLHGAEVKGYEDHRTIMALALAGMLATGETIINTAEGISKTYPDFVKCMRSLGAQMHMRPLVLMGFKHTGKSTVGVELAKLLNADFLDLDDLIVQLHGSAKTCREIVQNDGEAAFRELETQALKQALETHDGVLALGGGTALKLENQALLRLPTCVHLHADPDAVFKWIEAKGKPSYYGEGDFRQEFDQRWNHANPLYAKLADFSIETDRPAHEAAAEILEAI